MRPPPLTGALCGDSWCRFTPAKRTYQTLPSLPIMRMVALLLVLKLWHSVTIWNSVSEYTDGIFPPRNADTSLGTFFPAFRKPTPIKHKRNKREDGHHTENNSLGFREEAEKSSTRSSFLRCFPSWTMFSEMGMCSFSTLHHAHYIWNSTALYIMLYNFWNEKLTSTP